MPNTTTKNYMEINLAKFVATSREIEIGIELGATLSLTFKSGQVVRGKAYAHNGLHFWEDGSRILVTAVTNVELA